MSGIPVIPLHCENCRAPLAGGEAFCGNCGSRLTVPAPPASGPVPQEPLFFGHPVTKLSPRDRQLARESDVLTDSSRYLCAAAYLDPAFANTVIGELVATHRAVVPSAGIDLVPVIRHCLNARTRQLARDIAVLVLLLAGLVLAPVPTVAIVGASFFLAFLPGVRWDRRSIGKTFLAGAGSVAGLVFIAFLWAVIILLGKTGHAIPGFGPLHSGAGSVVAALVLVILLGTALASYYYSAYRILGERLGPEARVGGFERASDQAEDRIAVIDVAQQGNVTLYAGENPFIGSGNRGRAWSIAIELDRARGSASGVPWQERAAGGYVPIDPVELHRALRERLLALKDQGLPENERVSALTVGDHIVGEGRRRWDSPLIDQLRRIPYSQASKDAVEALIRHPQAGLRYYQRVCVSDEGLQVRAGGREVIGRADQEVLVSGYIYVAVEGRMFYLEFVPATLPPILRRYHVIDLLPKITSGKFMAKVLLHTAGMSFHDMIGAPFGLLGTLLRMWGEHRRFRKEFASREDYLFADVGARLSVRELGAAAAPHTYIQRLDAAKYTKIIERLITDTVLDFLVAKGVDTAAYRTSALAVINNGVVISGGSVSGPVAAGPGAQAHASARASAGEHG